MGMEVDRAGDRIEVELQIEVLGTDCLGTQFFDRTRTLAISRHGAKVRLERGLAPQEEVMVRCLMTGKEADARVVGQIAKVGDAYDYGIRFLDDKSDIWGFRFPPPPPSGGSTDDVLMECRACGNKEQVHLDEFEREVLRVNAKISQFCKQCRDLSVWCLTKGEMPASKGSTVATLTPFRERRSEPRRPMQVTACIRSARFGDDVVKARNVSRHGLSFASPWDYAAGQAIEVAVPFSPGGGNLFFPARIAYVQLQASEATRIYGVAYQDIKQ